MFLPDNWSNLGRKCSESLTIHRKRKSQSEEYNRGTMWLVSAMTTCLVTMYWLLIDPSRKLVEISPKSVHIFTFLICQAALPSFLNWRYPDSMHTTSPPRMDFFVKAKCFAADRAHCCKKAGHACVRRITSFAASPFRNAYGAWPQEQCSWC